MQNKGKQLLVQKSILFLLDCRTHDYSERRGRKRHRGLERGLEEQEGSIL